MIPLNRYTIVALAAVFSAYHVIRGVLTIDQAVSPWPSVIGMVLYLVVTALALFPTSPTRLPLVGALAALATAIVLPVLVTSQLDPTVNNGFATWHVSAVGTLMTIVAVRGHALIAWIGITFLAVQAVLWGGLLVAVETGVTGSIMWVAVAVVIKRSLERLSRDADELATAERKASQWQATQQAHESERRLRLEQTNRLALPVLRNVILTGGDLEDTERDEARVLEAGLRDEIRGRRLLNEKVRASVLEARRRGATVSLLDEGTLDGLAEPHLTIALDTVAEALAASTAQKYVVRTAPSDGDVAVTVVGLTPTDHPEEPGDTVVLWLEIPRFVRESD